MRKIFISAGHSTKIGRDRGASANGYVEGLEAAELRSLIVKELKLLGNVPIVDIDDSILSQTLAFFKNQTSANSIVLDIHFNAASPTVKGVETFIPYLYSKFELTLASKLSKDVAEFTGSPLRGIITDYKGVKLETQSARKKLGWMTLTGENVLLEVAFITNAEEMKIYRKNRFNIAKKIARTLYDASFMSEKTKLFYTVKSGDTLTKIAKNYNVPVSQILSTNKLKVSDIIKIGQVLTIIK